MRHLALLSLVVSLLALGVEAVADVHAASTVQHESAHAVVDDMDHIGAGEASCHHCCHAHSALPTALISATILCAGDRLDGDASATVLTHVYAPPTPPPNA